MDVMRRDSAIMRGDGPVVFAQVKNGPGVPEIIEFIIKEFRLSRGHTDHSKSIHVTAASGTATVATVDVSTTSDSEHHHHHHHQYEHSH